jgi:hypothetical protein
MKILEMRQDIDYADTVILEVQKDDKYAKFYVQTTDCEYRSDLGCEVDSTSEEEVEFDEDEIAEIIASAEQYIQDITKYTATDYFLDDCRLYIKNCAGEISVLQENPRFINSSSGYQREYYEVKSPKFYDEKEALNWIKNNHDGVEQGEE